MFSDGGSIPPASTIKQFQQGSRCLIKTREPFVLASLKGFSVSLCVFLYLDNSCLLGASHGGMFKILPKVPPHMPPLTEIKLRAIKPGEKVQRYYDTLGMYLEVTPSGGKYWRLKYRIDGKEKRAALGVWTEVSLKQARDKRDDLRKLIASGNAPSSAPAHNPVRQSEGTQKKFKDVAEAWRMNMGNVWADSHAFTVQRRLELDACP